MAAADVVAVVCGSDGVLEGLHPGRGHPGGGPGDGQEGPLPGQHGRWLVPHGPRGGCDGVLDGVGGNLGAVAVEVGRVLGAGETPEAGRQDPRRARPPGVAGQQARGRERQHHRRRPEAEENSKLFGEPASLDSFVKKKSASKISKSIVPNVLFRRFFSTKLNIWCILFRVVNFLFKKRLSPTPEKILQVLRFSVCVCKKLFNIRF